MTVYVQINDEVREANADELARLEQIAAEEQAHQDALAAQHAAKESARAKLAGLGLNDQEINALLGI
jgi:VIT1/CCC1 family predicted Fe2+/Mn2+ transporter